MIGRCLLALLFSFNLFATRDVPKEYLEPLKKDWEYLFQKKGVHVLTKEGDGLLMAFRGVMMAPVSPLNVLYVLRDVERSHLWTPNLVKKSMVKDVGPLEGITYNHNYLPWPAQDRDTVLYTKLFYEKAKNRLVVESYSVEDKTAPEVDGIIRAEVKYCIMYMKQFNTGLVMDIQAIIDPKGLVPAFLVNMIQQTWPVTFLSNLAEESKSGKWGSRPAFVEMVKQLKMENVIPTALSISPAPQHSLKNLHSLGRDE